MTAPHWIDGPVGAPVIVLAHSLGTSRVLWEPQVEPLAETHRVLRYDLRGHGAAPVPPGPYSVEDLGRDLLDLLDALELERVSFCGISLGGAVGMWLGLHAPERLERLVLACTSARFGSAELWSERAATVRANGVAPLVDGALERWFAADFRERRPEVVARFRELLASTPAEGYAACCDALRDWDVRGQLAAIAVPTLVVAGDEDVAAPPAEAELLAAEIPRGTLTVLAGAAHLANVEQPDAFTQAVLAHLS